MSKFLSWLAGKSSPPKPEELRRELRLLERRLERVERNIERKRKKALNSINKFLKNNEIEIAKEYAKQAVMLERDLKTIIKLRGKVTNLLTVVERGLIVDKIRESIEEIIPIVQLISRSLVDKKLQSELMELTKGLEQLEIGQEMLSESMSDILDESEVDETAEKLLKERMIELGLTAELVPTKTKEKKVSKEEIEKLLKEAEKEEE
jgi:hypothetical protein